jgi:hypothetical protein
MLRSVVELLLTRGVLALLCLAAGAALLLSTTDEERRWRSTYCLVAVACVLVGALVLMSP